MIEFKIVLITAKRQNKERESGFQFLSHITNSQQLYSSFCNVVFHSLRPYYIELNFETAGNLKLRSENTSMNLTIL